MMIDGSKFMEELYWIEFRFNCPQLQAVVPNPDP